jgi:hypothetical protein
MREVHAERNKRDVVDPAVALRPYTQKPACLPACRSCALPIPTASLDVLNSPGKSAW